MQAPSAGGARADQMMQNITGAHDYDQGPPQDPPRVTRQDLMERVNSSLVIGASVMFHGVGTYESVPHDPQGETAMLLYDANRPVRDLPTMPLHTGDVPNWTTVVPEAPKEWWKNLEGFCGRPMFPHERMPPLQVFRPGGAPRVPHWGEELRRLDPDAYSVKKEEYL